MLQTENIQNNYASLINSHGLEATPIGYDADKVEMILVKPDNIQAIADFLKKNPETTFDMLLSLSGVDTIDCFKVVYLLFSTTKRIKIIIKCELDKNNPEINSLTNIFKTADWHEREAYDLLGINFLNHPDLKRLLLPNDWIGHPLRKDYIMNDERLNWNQR